MPRGCCSAGRKRDRERRKRIVRHHRSVPAWPRDGLASADHERPDGRSLSPDCGNTRGSQRRLDGSPGPPFRNLEHQFLRTFVLQCSMPISGGHANFCGNPLTMRTVSTLVRNL